MNPDAPSIVVGKNLHDFLCLGCVTGYTFLEELSYQGQQYLDKIFDYEKHLQTVYADEEAVEGDREYLRVQREKLAFLSKELGLEPWADPVDKFTSLQAILDGQ